MGNTCDWKRSKTIKKLDIVKGVIDERRVEGSQLNVDYFLKDIHDCQHGTLLFSSERQKINKMDELKNIIAEKSPDSIIATNGIHSFSALVVLKHVTKELGYDKISRIEDDYIKYNLWR